eukprot:1092987-Pyramimonas_sp.AAC.1
MREVTLPWHFANPDQSPQSPAMAADKGAKFPEFLQFDAPGESGKERDAEERKRNKEKGYMFYRF